MTHTARVGDPDTHPLLSVPRKGDPGGDPGDLDTHPLLSVPRKGDPGTWDPEGTQGDPGTHPLLSVPRKCSRAWLASVRVPRAMDASQGPKGPRDPPSAVGPAERGPRHLGPRGDPGGPRDPPSAVGPAEMLTRLARIGSRPASDGCLAADTAHSTCFTTLGQRAVRLATSPAFARVGCCEPLDIDGRASSLAAPTKETTQAGPNPIEFRVCRYDQRELASEPLTYRNATCAAALP